MVAASCRTPRTSVPDNGLVVVDRLYWSANVLLPLHLNGRNRHWLTRAKSNTGGRVLKQLGTKDQLVEFDVSAEARKKNPALPISFTARMITYQRRGYGPQRLITSLVDPDLYPAAEIVDLYHERWEIEIGYDEVKTEMLEAIPLRSKSVDRVRQEIWGVLIAYNLIRLKMERVAQEADVPPTRISFLSVFRMICDEWLWCAIASPGATPGTSRTCARRSDCSYCHRAGANGRFLAQ